MDSSSDAKYFPWPSTVNFANFVTVKPCLEGGDFKIWKEQMTCLLESQDMLGFVDGETLPPSSEKTRWRRTDRLVKGWILGSIGKDVLDAVWEKPTARDVWLELENIFTKEEVAEKTMGETREDLSNIYSALYKAALRGDWDTAHKLFQDYNLDITTVISDESETALHMSVLAGNNHHFVKKMVELMPREALALKDSSGHTALHLASMVGNTKAAITMIDKNSDLLYIRDNGKRLAVLQAAVYGHKGTLEYLISKYNPNEFEEHLGVRLLNAIIASEFYDVALDIVYQCPNLARSTEAHFNLSALTALARTASAFLSGESIPVRMSKLEPNVAADIENTGSNAHAYRNYYTLFQNISGVKQKFESVVRKIIQVTMPSVWAIRNKKVVHQQALQLANYLCQQILTLPGMEASSMLHVSLISAAKNGIREVVEVIMEMYPEVTFNVDGATGGTIFHLAASRRLENVFSLIYSMTDRKHLLYGNTDDQDNNLMHICGKLAPPERLNLVPGAALQMQRELQWFKEMENFVQPSRRTWCNKNWQTPRMIFTNEHQQLKAEGERWMKDTANACTIAAALIATVMFTAAFTLPGGLDGDTGVPIFVEQPSFILFAISDAVSLFTSITSLLMFLSILTSRYAEEDFLYVLPKRLSIGLLSLFISITFMLVAFSATIYLVFRGRVPWFLIPAAALTCLPVASFVLLQFPLLVDVVYSTYGPGIFGKKTNRVFY